ncbi:hypothetical protein P2318_29025 [Myxococcaceae bacterium GXIMD 01537]
MSKKVQVLALSACLALGLLVIPTPALAQQYTNRVLNACNAWGYGSTAFYADGGWQRREMGWWYIPAGSVISVTVYTKNKQWSDYGYHNQRAPIEAWNNGSPLQVYSWDESSNIATGAFHWRQGKDKDKKDRILSQTIRVPTTDYYRVWPGNRGYGTEHITAWVKVYPAEGHAGYDPDCVQFWRTDNHDNAVAFSTLDYGHGMAGDGQNCDAVLFGWVAKTCLQDGADPTGFMRDAYGWTVMKANPGAHAHDTCCTKSHAAVTGVAANVCAGSGAYFTSKDPLPNATVRTDLCRWEWDRAADCQGKGDCAPWFWTDPAEGWGFGHDFAYTSYYTAQLFSGSDGPGGTNIETSGYYFSRTGAQGYKTGGAVSSEYALFDWMCQGGYCDGNQYELNPAWWDGAHCRCSSSSGAYRWGAVY